MNQNQNGFGSLEIGIWILFVIFFIWCLEFFQIKVSTILSQAIQLFYQSFGA